MESAGQKNELLTELKKMRLDPKPDSQFDSQADFHIWADIVDVLLTSAPEVQRKFRYKVEHVDTAHRFSSPTIASENEAIRVLARHILSMDLQPMFEEVGSEEKADAHPRLAEQEHPPAPAATALPWFQRPVGVVLLTVVGGVAVIALGKLLF